MARSSVQTIEGDKCKDYIYNYITTDISISNALFFKCTTTSTGGAIYIASGPHAAITSTSFVQCSSNQGSAFHITITENSFTGSQLFFEECTAALYDSTFIVTGNSLGSSLISLTCATMTQNLAKNYRTFSTSRGYAVFKGINSTDNDSTRDSSVCFFSDSESDHCIFLRNSDPRTLRYDTYHTAMYYVVMKCGYTTATDNIAILIAMKELSLSFGIFRENNQIGRTDVYYGVVTFIDCSFDRHLPYSAHVTYINMHTIPDSLYRATDDCHIILSIADTVHFSGHRIRSFNVQCLFIHLLSDQI